MTAVLTTHNSGRPFVLFRCHCLAQARDRLVMNYTLYGNVIDGQGQTRAEECQESEYHVILIHFEMIDGTHEFPLKNVLVLI